MRILAAALCAFAFLPGCFHEDQVTPKDYLTDKKYDTWIVEVDYAEGHKPDQALLDTLRSRLTEVARKPGGIQVLVDEEVADGGSWTTDEIQSFSREHKDHETSGDTVVTHLLILGGHSSRDDGESKVLGIAIDWDLIAIFDETIDSATSGGCPIPTLCSTPRRTVETAVYVHEFGHALGLVNRGVDMVRDHEDDDHPGHSQNEGSVMYWGVETTLGLSLLTGGPPTTFDADDKADLEAAGGK